MDSSQREKNLNLVQKHFISAEELNTNVSIHLSYQIKSSDSVKAQKQSSREIAVMQDNWWTYPPLGQRTATPSNAASNEYCFIFHLLCSSLHNVAMQKFWGSRKQMCNCLLLKLFMNLNRKDSSENYNQMHLEEDFYQYSIKILLLFSKNSNNLINYRN